MQLHNPYKVKIGKENSNRIEIATQIVLEIVMIHIKINVRSQ